MCLRILEIILDIVFLPNARRVDDIHVSSKNVSNTGRVWICCWQECQKRKGGNGELQAVQSEVAPLHHPEGGALLKWTLA